MLFGVVLFVVRDTFALLGTMAVVSKLLPEGQLQPTIHFSEARDMTTKKKRKTKTLTKNDI